MKKIILLLAILPLAMIVKAQKFGYVNSLELISLMPEAIEADSLLAVFQQSVQTQYNSYLQEYQTKAAEYDELLKTGTTAQLIMEAKASDLQGMQQRITDFETQSNTSLQDQRDKLYQPILVKATELVKQVAEENGYKMIFDTSSGAIAYAPEGDNVIKLLAAKLGVE
ncbi:MAG: outer membrane protein [Limisphaerales bacterium]